MGFRVTSCFLIVSAIAFAVVGVYCNSEGDALNAWKISLIDTNNVLQSWDPTLVNPCTWLHVSCDNSNRVTRIDLGNAGLQGPLVPQLGQLTYLQYFEAFDNNITGKIPKEFGNLRRLVGLDLYNNSVSGTIPPIFRKLTSLRFLRLSHNKFIGSIPYSIGNLLSLEILNLNDNKLSGDIPIEILSLVYRGNLRTLNVAGNLLTGTRRGNSTVTTIIQDPKAPKKI